MRCMTCFKRNTHLVLLWKKSRKKKQSKKRRVANLLKYYLRLDQLFGTNLKQGIFLQLKI